MISNQILQNTIDGLKNITRIDLCIIDTEGKILATTFAEADRYVSPAMALVESPAVHLASSRGLPAATMRGIWLAVCYFRLAHFTSHRACAHFCWLLPWRAGC